MKSQILFISVATAFLLAITVAQAGEDTDRIFRDVILSQIEAFANDDRDAAWEYASEGIRERTGSPETFFDMVKLSYGAVHRAAQIEFRERIPHAGFQIQVVRLLGPEGKRWHAAYRMVRNGDQWKIGGVSLREAPGAI